MPTLSGKNRAKTAELCHALADETRLDILDQLKDGERCVCELTDAMQAAPVADMSLFGLFWQAHFVVKLVMVGLLGASIWCWSIWACATATARM